VPRPLEAREVAAVTAVLVEGRGAQPGARGHHERHHALTPFLVGLADHGDVFYQWMSGQHLLHLYRVDVLSSADDHVVDATAHVQIARVVDIAHVAGEVPALAERLRVRVRTVPVPGECLVGVQAGDDLAFLSGRHRLVRGHAPLGARGDDPQPAMNPRTAGAVRLGVNVGKHGERVDLGGAVVVHEDVGTERLHARVGQRRQHGRARIRELPDRRDALGPE
jgi:hypothetical protein